jgi:hypothetical protein
VTDFVTDAPLYDVLGEGVEKVVFPPREFLSSAKRTLRRPILTFSIVLVAGEVVLVLFQHVPGVQLGVTVVVGDGEVVTDAEVDSSSVVTRCVLDVNFDFADEVQFPTVAVPHGSHLLDVLHGHVRACLVLYKDEVRAVLFEVEALAQTELVVLGIVLDAVLLPRHGRTRVFVAVFAIARWVSVLVSALACFVPTGERLSKLFENSLT